MKVYIIMGLLAYIHAEEEFKQHNSVEKRQLSFGNFGIHQKRERDWTRQHNMLIDAHEPGYNRRREIDLPPVHYFLHYIDDKNDVSKQKYQVMYLSQTNQQKMPLDQQSTHSTNHAIIHVYDAESNLFSTPFFYEKLQLPSKLQEQLLASLSNTRTYPRTTASVPTGVMPPANKLRAGTSQRFISPVRNQTNFHFSTNLSKRPLFTPFESAAAKGFNAPTPTEQLQAPFIPSQFLGFSQDATGHNSNESEQRNQQSTSNQLASRNALQPKQETTKSDCADRKLRYIHLAPHKTYKLFNYQ